MMLVINAMHPLNSSSVKEKQVVRSYHPIVDQPAIVDICKHVCKSGRLPNLICTSYIYRYHQSPTSHTKSHPIHTDGGSDRLPQRLPSEATKPNTAIVVAADPTTDLVNAITCSKSFRNHFIWVWGVRTRETMAGQGLATQLLSHIESHWKEEEEKQSPLPSSSPPSVTIVTTTTPSNTAMIKILENLNYKLQGHVSYWPPSSVVETITNGGQTLKDLIRPSASQDAIQLTDKWRPALSISDLECFLIDTRNHTTTNNYNSIGGEDTIHNNNNNKLLPSWLPHDYSVYPPTYFEDSLGHQHDCTTTGRVFILDDDDDSSSSSSISSRRSSSSNKAVVVINQGYVEDLWFAGIVATSPVALEAAALKAVDIEPGCSILYVDRCECFETCDLLQSHGGSSLYSVYYKHL
jgi:hypothetical protein